MKGSYAIELFSEIGPDTLKVFSEQVKKAGARPIRLRLNSPGGLVGPGLAMAALVKGHKAGVFVEILGLAASMATVVAVAGKPVRMAENALFMIHNPWLETAGNAHHLRKTAAELDQITVPLVNAYCARTGRAEAEIRALMDAESWLSAAEAKKLGFVDEIGAPSAEARASIAAAARKWPKLAAALAKARKSNPQNIADQYAKMPPGPARLDFFSRHKWALFASRKQQNITKI
jgi:ATP-dependent protease ClpP protease subunit